MTQTTTPAIAPGIKGPRHSTMLRNALRLCERMATTAIEMRLITRLPVLVKEYGQAPYACARALRELAEVRALLEIDPELLLHAEFMLPRAVLAAVDEVANTFVEDLDKDGWREV